MRVLLISFSFVRGGAGIAAAKSFSLLHWLGIDSTGVSAEYSPLTGEDIRQPGRFEFAWHYLLRSVEHLFLRCFFRRDAVKGSLNLHTAPVIRKALKSQMSEGQIIHVHWINNSTLSVQSLGRLPIGSIISLHDEWLYSGVEHYILNGNYGESAKVRPRNGIENVFDRWVKKRKYRSLAHRNDILYTVPSRWMLEKAKNSQILSGKDLRLLPNPIDTDVFCSIGKAERDAYRRLTGIENNVVVIGFGAVDCEKNVIKGGSLLREAIQSLVSSSSKITQECVMLLFGKGSEGVETFAGLPAIGLGHIDTVDLMRQVYNACDFLVVPSLVEAFGQTAAECQSCETPVVCFNHSGLSDIVDDGLTGLTAEPFSVISLADCLRRMILAGCNERQRMGKMGRKKILEQFSIPAVSEVYEDILKDAESLRVSCER